MMWLQAQKTTTPSTTSSPKTTKPAPDVFYYCNSYLPDQHSHSASIPCPDNCLSKAFLFHSQSSGDLVVMEETRYQGFCLLQRMRDLPNLSYLPTKLRWTVASKCPLSLMRKTSHALRRTLLSTNIDIGIHEDPKQSSTITSIERKKKCNHQDWRWQPPKPPPPQIQTFT